MIPTVASMLQANYYGWFERVSRGRYTLTASGKQALIEYAHVIQASRTIISNQTLSIPVRPILTRALCIHTADKQPSAIATVSISE